MYRDIGDDGRTGWQPLPENWREELVRRAREAGMLNPDGTIKNQDIGPDGFLHE